MRFAIATLLPVPLLTLAVVVGGSWPIIALVYMTGLVFALDTFTDVDDPREFPAADALSVALGVLHFPLMAIVVWGLSHDALNLAQKALLFIAAGQFFGQVSNANAHELIHRSSRLRHRLGMWVYISHLFGHHTSAHVLVHHRYVATDKDPSSSRLGESFYRFYARAWVGSFKLGLEAERERLRRIGRSSWHNPYLVYGAGSALMIALSALIGGGWGVLAYGLIASYASLQQILADYVQHYGLRRAVLNGKTEPVNERHSWNTPHWYSSALMMNAPRHSDHHSHPTRPYQELKISEDTPTLPRSLPVMATLALFPSIWRRIMDPRVKKWTNV